LTEASITPAEALTILQTIRPKSSSELKAAPKSALDILQANDKLAHIITFCGEIDEMLGGGVPVGEVTEFCGVPGIGKTQIGIQLAVDVHLPAVFGGAEGHAIYLDTEGSFMAERAAEIAQAFVTHVKRMARVRNESSLLEAAGELSVESILENIHFCRIHDWAEQVATVNMLCSLLDQHPRVRLIVIDSVAFHFRHDFDDFAARARLMAGMANTLTQIARTRNVAGEYQLYIRDDCVLAGTSDLTISVPFVYPAVVLINQVTTKVGHQGSAYIAPALGESWSHLCSSRIMLSWEAGCRQARLVKSTTFR
jgi:RAD51-like protein 2